MRQCSTALRASSVLPKAAADAAQTTALGKCGRNWARTSGPSLDAISPSRDVAWSRLLRQLAGLIVAGGHHALTRRPQPHKSPSGTHTATAGSTAPMKGLIRPQGRDRGRYSPSGSR